jgi:ABC-type nickel/cobalt efflux system permease component RcnA
MKLEIVRELLQFLVENKKWWLGTIVVLLMMLGLLLVLTEGSALAPFIYALF